jgi:hypothetical protein
MSFNRFFSFLFIFCFLDIFNAIHSEIEKDKCERKIYPLVNNYHHNADPFIWKKDDLTYFNNSPFMKSFIQTHYSNSLWNNPIAFVTIADTKYIPSIEYLLDSLTSFSFTQDDLLVACFTLDCVQKSSLRSIRTVLYRDEKECNISSNNHSNSANLRCFVGNSKFSIISDLLNLNINIFFLDLDAYIKSFPLPLKLDSMYEMYAQYNSQVKINEKYNFGCFLIRSTKQTKKAFLSAKNQFLANPLIFDQLLFDMKINEYKIKTKEFNRQAYSSFSKERNNNIPLSKVVIGHTTCMEGAENKFLFGRLIYSPLALPSFYSPLCHKTLTIAYSSLYTHTQLIGLIKLAITLMKNNNKQQQNHRRYLRLINWNYFKFQSYKALYNADLLYDYYNITIVEEFYWKNVKYFYSSFYSDTGDGKVQPSSMKIMINNLTDLTSHMIVDTSSVNVNHYHSLHHHHSHIDDWILHIENPQFLTEFAENAFVMSVKNNDSDNNYHKVINDYSIFLCHHYQDQKKGFECQKTCHGSHL